MVSPNGGWRSKCEVRRWVFPRYCCRFWLNEILREILCWPMFILVLFRFRLSALTLSGALGSIILRHPCAPTATRSYLATVCRLLFCFFGDVACSGYCIPLPLPFCMGRMFCVVSLPGGVFLPCDHGLDFCISLLCGEFNQSIKLVIFCVYSLLSLKPDIT